MPTFQKDATMADNKTVLFDNKAHEFDDDFIYAGLNDRQINVIKGFNFSSGLLSMMSSAFLVGWILREKRRDGLELD